MKKIIFIIIIIYSIMIIFEIYHHETWRDEAYVWMNAKEHTIPQIIQNIRYEQTPILSTLVVLPFAKLGFPYFTMQLINAFIAIFAISILLFKLKLPLVYKILIICSYHISYEYAVISRNYILTVVLLFAIAALHNHRRSKPILYAICIGLLFNTNVYSIFPAGLLFITFAIETIVHKKFKLNTIFAIIIMVVIGLFSIITLIPDPSIHQNLYFQPNPQTEIFSVIRGSIVPLLLQVPFKIFELSSFNYLCIILSCITILSFLLITFKNPYVFILSLFIIGWLFFINTYLHTGNNRHHGLILVYLIFLWSIINTYNSKNGIFYLVIKYIFNVSLFVLLILSCCYTPRIYYLDYKYDFSGSKDIASFIINHKLENINTAVYFGPICRSILPYLNNKKFWYPEYLAYGYLNDPDILYLDKIKNFSEVIAFERIQSNFSDGKPYLLITDQPYAETHNYYPIHTSISDKLGYMESYYLYTNNDKLAKQLNKD
jgi:hypothetical protein